MSTLYLVRLSSRSLGKSANFLVTVPPGDDEDDAISRAAEHVDRHYVWTSRAEMVCPTEASVFMEIAA